MAGVTRGKLEGKIWNPVVLRGAIFVMELQDGISMINPYLDQLVG